MLTQKLSAVLLLAGSALALNARVQEVLRCQPKAGNVTHSFDVARCPGYALHALSETHNGLTAKLNLAGAACNAFGTDVANLTIEVTYETPSRLHVHIYDTAKAQFTIPESVVPRPAAAKGNTAEKSDLVPFAFWITRRSAPHAAPLFDTRISSFPPTPIAPVMAGDNSTALDGFPLVFENQYLQLASALPLGANIYGLGEVVASSGIRRDVGTNGGVGTVQNNWARDVDLADHVDENLYGVHPIYMEHRFNGSTHTSQAHGVFLLNPAGADILLLTPPASPVSLIEYRVLGGTLDLYFLAGPTPQRVMRQYAQLVGTPTPQPVWAFGFHLCRWGYTSLAAVQRVVAQMRRAGVPLEAMWGDIDVFDAFRDFTADPGRYAPEEMRAWIAELGAGHQRYVPIVDAAIPKEVNSTDFYAPYSRGTELDVFIKNPDGTEYVGQVWPGYTVFPDWFAPNTLGWWTEALRNWSALGVEFSGIWLDMNEASSFCDGSCGSGIDIGNTSTPFILPGEPGNFVAGYPEGYNAAVSGPSGNITVNGTLAYGATAQAALAARGIGAGNQSDVDLNAPPYAIHNENGRLSLHALATNATHAGGYAELDVHSLWGLMQAEATHKALQAVLPNTRPFIISRSAFASAGRWAGHWLGDNFSKWDDMYFSIQGVLQHQLFQIPFVGADACGFNDNAGEELCGRWMQLAAFTPFYRNHNIRGAIPQEPYVWDSVAAASRTAIAVRYALLPYWYSLFANASIDGTPPVRALFWEFPDEPELFSVDRQFMVGSDILVTPVLTPNVSSVDGIFPGRGKMIWRDWYTGATLNATAGANTTLPAPLGHIPVHVRGGAALLLHSAPAYTIEETREGPFALLVSPAADGSAFGTSYLDDGVSNPPGPSTTVTVRASTGRVKIESTGKFRVAQKLEAVTVLGVAKKPAKVEVGGKKVKGVTFTDAEEKLVISGLAVDLNKGTTISWK
ncbi:glycosyl hydrolases family 31-domain-containing protein [Mycena belliarum]|uniref:Glycosyl hydrolases family 31-domain-containing protein n=1 Tax=Mycena belliarum TaxID=1033014 RepID=A0AAD6TYP2_9AGAR|nr:glycosyl hydrolases family 31-domain-containing protein [Mycena belliae]